MAPEDEWQARVHEVIEREVRRTDVRVAARVRVDGDVPLEDFDEEEFAEWLGDWIDFTVASTAGPVMPGTAETEWTIGDSVTISILLSKTG